MLSLQCHSDYQLEPKPLYSNINPTILGDLATADKPPHISYPSRFQHSQIQLSKQQYMLVAVKLYC